MRTRHIFFFFALLLVFSCSKDLSKSSSSASNGILDGAFSEDASGSGSGSEEGLITAGEWNDIEKWDFWNELMSNDEFSVHQEYWGIYPEKRISVHVTQFGETVTGAEIQLLHGGTKVASARSDNKGNAELFIDLFQESTSTIDQYTLQVGDAIYNEPLILATEGVNEVSFEGLTSVKKLVQLSFIVDATGSMGDELNFLKEDLRDVISRTENAVGAYGFETSTVFYRDEADDYITKESDFSTNINTTLSFIKEQFAGGGGDFPEAVHTAMEACLNLDWDKEAQTKIAFLLLDAPPHYNLEVLREIRSYIELAASKGIKIIPITASGINKETEFLMRFMSIATNGTYVFITNDSGIGNNHITASVGDYEVEFLNDLMVRIMKKYIE